MIGKLKDWARAIKRDVHAIYLAARDPRVPWYTKALALCVAGYALSPIDLIPDFIPVFGYLDDLIIVPLGILAVVKLIPPEVMAEHRAAAAIASERPISRAAAAAIVAIWVASMALVGWLGYRYWLGVGHSHASQLFERPYNCMAQIFCSSEMAHLGSERWLYPLRVLQA